MLIFLDTEYTGLGQVCPKLISLALVAEDGQREFYVELTDTWRLNDCAEFVKHEVLPLLQGPSSSEAEARDALRAWFADAPREVQIACDSETDFRFLINLLGAPRPENLAACYFDLRPLIDTAIYDQVVADYYQIDNRLHHALTDARAYRRGWLAWMDEQKHG